MIKLEYTQYVKNLKYLPRGMSHTSDVPLFCSAGQHKTPTQKRRSIMNRFIRRMNTRKIKKIAKLSGISAAIILLFILLLPLFTFTSQVFYGLIILVVLGRLWIEGLRD
jgi:hypothetical protein